VLINRAFLLVSRLSQAASTYVAKGLLVRMGSSKLLQHVRVNCQSWPST